MTSNEANGRDTWPRAARRVVSRGDVYTSSKLLAVVVSALLLAACGEDDAAQSVSTPTPTRDAAGVEGTGYTLRPPEGFRDVTSQFDGSAVNVDLAFREPAASGFASNLIVMREQREALDLDEVTETFIKQVEPQATDAGIDEIEDDKLGGAPAKTFSFLSRNDQKGPVRQRLVVAVKRESVYTITWSVAADDFEAQEATLDRTLASWRWS